MEFRDLKQQYRRIKPGVDAAVLQTFEAADYISGPAVTALERRLSAYTGRKNCITCANGTDALVLVLRAWGIGPGDAVFVPDFTFFASAECIRAVGAVPIFVDVDETTFNLSPAALESDIASFIQKNSGLAPKAVISVDLFGLPADYLQIESIVAQHGLLLLEDAAQGFGGAVSGRRACSFGAAATTSFFPAKPLGCYGDGGAVFTDDNALADVVRSLAVHGKKGSDKYDNIQVGYNSRLDTLQADILLEKMKIFDDELEEVNKNAAAYTELLSNVFHTPFVPDGVFSSWAQYTLRLESGEQRQRIQHALAAEKIPSMIYYKRGMHEMEAFRSLLDIQVDPCIVSKKLTDTVLSLPIHPYLSGEDIGQVAAILKNNR